MSDIRKYVELIESCERLDSSNGIPNNSPQKSNSIKYVLESEEIKIGDARLSYKIDDEDKIIDLWSIRVAQAKRKKGAANEGLRWLTNKADELGYEIRLIASPLDKRTRADTLVKFYKNHGFELTGKSANPVGDPFMLRTPK